MSFFIARINALDSAKTYLTDLCSVLCRRIRAGGPADVSGLGRLASAAVAAATLKLQRGNTMDAKSATMSPSSSSSSSASRSNVSELESQLEALPSTSVLDSDSDSSDTDDGNAVRVIAKTLKKAEDKKANLDRNVDDDGDDDIHRYHHDNNDADMDINDDEDDFAAAFERTSRRLQSRHSSVVSPSTAAGTRVGRGRSVVVESRADAHSRVHRALSPTASIASHSSASSLSPSSSTASSSTSTSTSPLSIRHSSNLAMAHPGTRATGAAGAALTSSLLPVGSVKLASSFTIARSLAYQGPPGAGVGLEDDDSDNNSDGIGIGIGIGRGSGRGKWKGNQGGVVAGNVNDDDDDDDEYGYSGYGRTKQSATLARKEQDSSGSNKRKATKADDDYNDSDDDDDDDDDSSGKDDDGDNLEGCLSPSSTRLSSSSSSSSSTAHSSSSSSSSSSLSSSSSSPGRSRGPPLLRSSTHESLAQHALTEVSRLEALAEATVRTYTRVEKRLQAAAEKLLDVVVEAIVLRAADGMSMFFSDKWLHGKATPMKDVTEQMAVIIEEVGDMLEPDAYFAALFAKTVAAVVAVYLIKFMNSSRKLSLQLLTPSSSTAPSSSSSAAASSSSSSSSLGSGGNGGPAPLLVTRLDQDAATLADFVDSFTLPSCVPVELFTLLRVIPTMSAVLLADTSSSAAPGAVSTIVRAFTDVDPAVYAAVISPNHLFHRLLVVRGDVRRAQRKALLDQLQSRIAPQYTITSGEVDKLTARKTDCVIM